MGQIKAQDVDWLNEAWLVSVALAGTQDAPVGSGLLSPTPHVHSRRKWKLNPTVETYLKTALQTLTLHLFYRLNVAHRVKMPTTIDGTRWFHDITDPTELLITWCLLRPTLDSRRPFRDELAFEVAFRLASVLKERYCNPVWKREIPLLVAGIGGKSASAHARHIAHTSRGQRSNRLTDGLAVCVGRNPHAIWKELLDDLSGDDVVIAWDGEFVFWLDDDGERQTTSTGTFRNLLTKIKKSK